MDLVIQNPELVETKSGSFRWVSRASQRHPGKWIFIVIAAIFAFLLGILFMRSIFSGLIGASLILGFCGDGWLSHHYEVSSKGVKSRTGVSISEIMWQDIVQVKSSEYGFRFLPILGDGRMVAFRGVFVAFDGTSRDEILEAITKFGGENVRKLV